MSDSLDRFAIIKPDERSLLLDKLASLAQSDLVDWPLCGPEGLWSSGKPIPWEVLMVGQGDQLKDCFDFLGIKPPEILMILHGQTDRILKGAAAGVQRHLLAFTSGAGVVIFNEEVTWAIIINHSGVVSLLKETER